MEYFKVKESSDQTPKPGKQGGFLIKNELYTQKQLDTQGMNNMLRHFNTIELPKSQIYWMFGARFMSIPANI